MVVITNQIRPPIYNPDTINTAIAYKPNHEYHEDLWENVVFDVNRILVVHCLEEDQVFYETKYCYEYIINAVLLSNRFPLRLIILIIPYIYDRAHGVVIGEDSEYKVQAHVGNAVDKGDHEEDAHDAVFLPLCDHALGHDGRLLD